MPKGKEERKTHEFYGKRFCVLTNSDIKLMIFVNDKLEEFMNDYAAAGTTNNLTDNKEAMGEALRHSRGKIMSLIAWIYGEARVKEDEMNN